MRFKNPLRPHHSLRKGEFHLIPRKLRGMLSPSVHYVMAVRATERPLVVWRFLPHAFAVSTSIPMSKDYGFGVPVAAPREAHLAVLALRHLPDLATHH